MGAPPGQNELFEVKYDSSFYSLLFKEGYCSLVGKVRSTGRIVAVASARWVDDDAGTCDTLKRWLRGQTVGYVLTMGVHQDFRKRGLGRAMLQVCRDRHEPPVAGAVIEYLPLVASQELIKALHDARCTTIELHCLCNNTAAVALYEVRVAAAQSLPSVVDLHNRG